MSDEEPRLSHVDEAGGVRMVDVGAKPVSRRRAVAGAFVEMAPATSRRLRELPKGDALATAQLAGIMAAKQTASLIPLCHQLPLSVVEVDTRDRQVGRARSRPRRRQPTGRVSRWRLWWPQSVAALTVYDMAKAIDKGMVVTGVRLLEKTKDVR